MIFHEIREIFNYHLGNTEIFAKHDCRNVFEKAIKDCESTGFDGLSGKKILDLGCGQRFSFSLQCAAAGADATALDLNYVEPHSLPVTFYETLRHNGLKRAGKSILRRLLFDGKYFELLSGLSGRDLKPYIKNINFIVSDPLSEKYPLPSETSDFIASNAVLEHVENVPQFASEVFRLLKKGGFFYGLIHNFYSISGGHNLDWAYPDTSPPKNIPPWDHIRENRFPSWVPLNRLLPEEYQRAFSEKLKILLFSERDANHDPGGIEGEQFYTPEIAEELSQYPKELLLTRAWCIICQKK